MRRIKTIFLGIVLATALVFNSGLVQPASAAVTPGGGGGGGSASPLENLSILDQVRYFDRYRAFRSCVQNEFIFMEEPGGPIYVLARDLSDPSSWKEAGRVAIGVSNDLDQMAECQNVTGSIINDLGYGSGPDENQKFLEAMGFKLNANRSNGISRFEFNGSYKTLQGNYDRLAAKYMGVNPESFNSDGAIIYARALWTAEKMCGMTLEKPLRERTPAEKIQAPTPNPKPIWYPNPINGTVEEFLVNYDIQGENWGGTFRYFETAAGGPVNITCAKVMEILRVKDNALAYQKHVNSNPTANAGGPNSSAGVTGTPGDVEDDCPLPTGTPMKWFGCSIMSVAALATEKLYGAIQNFLYTPTSMIFENPALKKASDGIRNIAIGLILIAGLVMVIAQATGSDLFDAYTLRKLLPRIGVAIIGIALAWPLLRFAVTLTNDIGLLADRLLMGVTGLGTTGSDNGFGTNIGSTIFGTAAVGGTVLILGAAGVISLAGTLLLALLIGLLVLGIRQLVIMVCILLAPLAIAAYVLPGTQKLWGFWKNTLITTLLMFPIIMFFLASGKAFSAVLGGANSTTMSLLAIIVFIAPYFLLPFAFKLAGGLMSTIFSIANDKNRGMFDRLRKGRQNAVSNNIGKIRSGTRYAGGNETNLRGKLNRGLANTSNAPGAILASGNTFRPSKWGSATTAARTSNVMAEIEKNQKENRDLQPWLHDDLVSRAASESNNESELRANLIKYEPKRFQNDSHALDQTVSQVMSVKRQMSSKAFKAMSTLQAVAGGTAYKDNAEFVDAIASAGMGDSALTAHLTNQARSMANSAGRYEQGGASFGTTLGLIQIAQKRINGAPVQANEPPDLGLALNDAAYRAQPASTMLHASMKDTTIKNVAPIIASDVTSNLTDENVLMRHLAAASNAYDTQLAASPDKADIIAKELMGREIDLTACSPEVLQRLAPAIELAERNKTTIGPLKSINIQQAVEGTRGDKTVQLYRREYAQQALPGDLVQHQSTTDPIVLARMEEERRNHPGSPGGSPGTPPIRPAGGGPTNN